MSKYRVIVPARRIEVERDSTVAATLGTAVDTLAPTAGRHVNLQQPGEYASRSVLQKN